MDTVIKFYLSSLWAALPEGRNRVMESLKSLDLENAHFLWDKEAGWLQVRCVVAVKKDIVKKYIEIQSEIASEMKAQGAIQGAIQSPLLGVPGPDMPVIDDMIELRVPTKLSKFEVVTAWQDLQPGYRKFSVGFLMDGALKAIEQAHGVKLHVDWPAEVIFVGAASSSAADAVKEKLTTLLRSSLSLRARTRHIFFVDEKASLPGWTIDVRDAKQINPVLASSTLLDLLDHLLPEKYKTVFNDAYCLRICYMDPFKDITWSTFGPRAPDVFGGKAPKRSSAFFESVQTTPKERRSVPQVDTVATIKKWVQDLPKPKPDGTSVLGAKEILRTMDLDGLAADAMAADAAREKHSLLGDAGCQDSASTSQRPLPPRRRAIMVAHPETLPKYRDPRPQPVATRGSMFDQHIKFLLQNLIRPMKAKYGVVQLRAEIGRFFLEDIDQSGVARNKEGQPANGWEPDQLLTLLHKTKGNNFFTKILSYWGDDVDYLVDMKDDKRMVWDPMGQPRTFFDFHFHARNLVGTVSHFVLEVDGCTFTWNLREARSPYEPIIVHCLAQNWDFRLVALHDYTLDQEVYFGEFARALVDSLIVRPPVLEFQYSFDDGTPITVDEVRIRQVRRFQTQSKKTLLDITRVFPTEVKNFPGTKYRAVRSLPNDDCEKGVFKGWYEASVSSARMEELLKQNETLAPGDEVEWTFEQLEKEGVFEDIYQPACQIVKSMDGVGVKCDNGMSHRDEISKGHQSQSSYRF